MLISEKTENPSALYESRRRLDLAMTVLSPEDKMIVALSELEGWKNSEVAEMMDKTEGFVKMRLARARKKMRRRLSARYFKKKANNIKGNQNSYALPTGSRKTE